MQTKMKLDGTLTKVTSGKLNSQKGINVTIFVELDQLTPQESHSLLEAQGKDIHSDLEILLPPEPEKEKEDPRQMKIDFPGGEEDLEKD